MQPAVPAGHQPALQEKVNHPTEHRKPVRADQRSASIRQTLTVACPRLDITTRNSNAITFAVVILGPTAR
jgi:hypothetical protein